MVDPMVEAMEAGEKLNEEIRVLLRFDEYDGGVSHPLITVTTSGLAVWVEFLDCTVWDSEVDERRFSDSSTSGYEPIENYIRRKIGLVLDTLQKLTPLRNG